MLLDILFLQYTMKQFLRQTMLNFNLLNLVARLAARASDIFV